MSRSSSRSWVSSAWTIKESSSEVFFEVDEVAAGSFCSVITDDVLSLPTAPLSFSLWLNCCPFACSSWSSFCFMVTPSRAKPDPSAILSSVPFSAEVDTHGVHIFVSRVISVTKWYPIASSFTCKRLTDSTIETQCCCKRILQHHRQRKEHYWLQETNIKVLTMNIIFTTCVFHHWLLFGRRSVSEREDERLRIVSFFFQYLQEQNMHMNTRIVLHDMTVLTYS